MTLRRVPGRLPDPSGTLTGVREQNGNKEYRNQLEPDELELLEPEEEEPDMHNISAPREKRKPLRRLVAASAELRWLSCITSAR